MSKSKKGGLLSNIANISFQDALAVVSILGFLAILVKSVADVSIAEWVDGLLFIIIGGVLLLAGGFYSIIKYFENGLTNDEITKILTVFVGLISFLVGIFTFPFPAFDPIEEIPVVEGTKTIIAGLAIIVIAVDSWVQKSLIK